MRWYCNSTDNYDSLISHFREKDTRNALFIYSIYSFIIIGFDDLFSLWTATPRYQGTWWSIVSNVMILLNLGGLGFSLHNIGISLTAVGIMLLPLSFFLFLLVSWLVTLTSLIHSSFYRPIDTLGPSEHSNCQLLVTYLEWCFFLTSTTLTGEEDKFIFAWAYIFSLLAIPNRHSIQGISITDLPSLTLLLFSFSTVLVWAMLCVILLLIRVSIALCLASSYLFINNSVTFDKLGSVNGLGMTITAFFRYKYTHSFSSNSYFLRSNSHSCFCRALCINLVPPKFRRIITTLCY